MSKKITNLAEARKAIKSVDSRLCLAKGQGYYYFYSDDEDLSLKLSELSNTSVYINLASDQTEEQWINDAKDVMTRIDKKS